MFKRIEMIEWTAVYLVTLSLFDKLQTMAYTTLFLYET